jgi:hypothetical protein
VRLLTPARLLTPSAAERFSRKKALLQVKVIAKVLFPSLQKCLFTEKLLLPRELKAELAFIRLLSKEVYFCIE